MQLSANCFLWLLRFCYRPALTRRPMHPQNIAQGLFQLAPLNDPVDKAMLQQKLCPLKALRQLLPGGLLDNPGACESDQRARLCQNNIALHGKAGGDAAGGRISQYRDIE